MKLVVFKKNDCTGDPLYWGSSENGTIGWWTNISWAQIFENRKEAEKRLVSTGARMTTVEIKHIIVKEGMPHYWGQDRVTNKWGRVYSVSHAHKFHSARACSSAIYRLRKKGNVGIFRKKIVVDLNQ